MTAAVCLKCGRMKVGAWTPCPACSYRPDTVEDRARHLIVTDHYQKAEVLEQISQRIQAGQPPQFVEEQVRQVAEALAEEDAKFTRIVAKQKLTPRGMLIAIAMLAGIAWLVWRLFIR